MCGTGVVDGDGVRAFGAVLRTIRRISESTFVLPVGFTEQEIAELDLSEMSEEEFQRLMKEKREAQGVAQGAQQKIAPVEQVNGYID